MGTTTGDERAAVRIVDGHRVGLRVEGDGEPLVLLHGIGRSLADWDLVLPALATRYTVYAMDLEGFGATERFTDRLSLTGQAALVRRTLQSVGEHRPVRVIGNSLGGAVAMRFAADEPDRIVALVLVSAAGFGSDAAFGLRVLTLWGVGPLLLHTGRLGSAVQVRTMFADRRQATHERIQQHTALSRRPGAARSFLEMIHDLGAWGGVREEWREEVVTALAAAKMPTLVLWGDQDHVLPPRHLAAAADLLPHARTRPLSDIGHAPQLEDPQRFLAEVLPFLLETDRGPEQDRGPETDGGHETDGPLETGS